MSWHHAVEQTPSNLARFGPAAIHNTGNLHRLPDPVHAKISAHYSSIRSYTNGLTVRKWLSTQSFEAQQAYGRMLMMSYKVLP